MDPMSFLSRRFGTHIEGPKKAPAVSEWIPVSERLPEKTGYFLTSTVFDDVYCDFWNGFEFERTEMILAWMPLPEPYKKEGDQ